MKRTILPAILLLLPLLLIPILFAQPAAPVLTIRILGESDLPLSGAQVILSSLAQPLSTNDAGTIDIATLPPGEYSLTVTAPDYFPSHATRVQITANQPTTVVTVRLQPRTTVSETVVVTATGTLYAPQEAPIRTELIRHETIDRQIKTTLAEAFQATVSGVRMEMNCQNCGFMQIRMNGLEGPYTQILEDGLPSFSGVTAVYGLEQIPAAFVDQIEIVKGGNSSLYGPGAVAGVVNLIRREPRENRFRVDLLSGWHYGRPEQQGGASAQLIDLPGGFSGDFYYRGVNRVPVDRDRDGFSDLGKRKLDTGGFGLFRRLLNDTARLTINGTVASEFRRGGDMFHLAPHQTNITEQVDSRRYTLAMGFNHAVSPRTFYNLRASHAGYTRDTYYGSGFDPNAYGSTRNPLWVGDAQVGHQKGRHSLLAGYQLWHDTVADHAPSYQRTYGGTFQNHGFYFQDEYRTSSKLTLIGGARIDRSNQVDRLIVSPRAGIRYGINDSLVWRATLSTGFRAPAVFDEDLHIAQVGGEGFLLQNEANLREERSLSFTTGFDYTGLLAGRPFQLASSIFHTGLRDAFTLMEDIVPGSGFRRLLRVNAHGAAVSGISFDTNLKLTRSLALRGAYTVQRALWDEPEPQFGARHFFRTPNQYGFAGFDWDLPFGVELTGTLDYTGSMTVPHYAGYIPEDRLETSKRFLVANAVIGRTFTISDTSRLRLFCNLQNLGDAFQPDLDKGPNRDSGYVYGPAEMRRAIIGLTWEF